MLRLSRAFVQSPCAMRFSSGVCAVSVKANIPVNARTLIPLAPFLPRGSDLLYITLQIEAPLEGTLHLLAMKSPPPMKKPGKAMPRKEVFGRPGGQPLARG